jgi:hypothetical protein
LLSRILREKGSPNFPQQYAARFAAQKKNRRILAAFLKRFSPGEFLGQRWKSFFPSFLLAHCGGGQDKPGLPWPLSEAPRLSFFLVPSFSLPEFSIPAF